MIITQFAADVRKDLRARMNDIADAMANGACTSFDHYKDLCGEIRGLAFAETQLIALSEAIEKTEMEKR